MELFNKILQLVWIDTSIEKLQAARLLYNQITKNQYQFKDKQICDLYSNLLQKIKTLKNKYTFKQRVSIMKIDFIIFQLYEYQHFPDLKKNCNMQSMLIQKVDQLQFIQLFFKFIYCNINQSTFVEDVIFLQRKNGVYVWMDVLVNFIKIQINIQIERE